jgi:hypothetical protein
VVGKEEAFGPTSNGLPRNCSWLMAGAITSWVGEDEREGGALLY